MELCKPLRMKIIGSFRILKLILHKIMLSDSETRRRTVLRVPFMWLKFPSLERNLERSLRMQSSNNTVLPLPVGAEMTMFISDWKQ